MPTQEESMNQTRTLALTLLLGLLLLGGAAYGQGKLFLYNWTDYTAPGLIEKFEQETGIEVVIDTFDTNETLLAKLKSGAAGYDIVVPSHNFVPILIEEGLLQPINAPELDSYANLQERWRNPEWDPGNVYSVPWVWGTTSFSVNTSKFGGDIDSYSLLFEPPAELRGAIGMHNSPDDVINMALAYLGERPCSEDPEVMRRVLDLLLAQKPFVKVYNSDGILERLLSGDVIVHMNWNGYSMRAREENPAIRYAYPREAVMTWMDNLTVPKGAPNKENALAFIEFFMRPENAALQSNFARYANTYEGSGEYMDDDLKSAPELQVPEGITTVFAPACSEEAIRLMDRVWTRVKQ
jgi:spermidine/putrescine transport system substrate-binding protein